MNDEQQKQYLAMNPTTVSQQDLQSRQTYKVIEHHKYGLFLIELKEDYKSIPTTQFIKEFHTLGECREFQFDYSHNYGLKTIIIPVY